VSTHVPALVIGGGISGLACAYALRKSGIDAHVVESSDHPGGIIRSVHRNGYLLELGPQSFSATAPLLDLCRELGIENELLDAPSKAPRFLVIGGKLREAPLSPPAFFASSLFSLKTKGSVLRDILGRSLPPTEDESISAFVRRKFSPELLEKLVGPFVSGIYAGDSEKLSARAAFPQLYEAELASGSVIRGMMRAAKSKEEPRQRPKLCSFRDGNETLLRALGANLGANLRCGVEVTNIQHEGAGNGPTGLRFVADVRTFRGRETIVADHLVVATPSQIAAQLLKNIDSAFPAALREIEYAPVAVVSLGYRNSDVLHSLNGFGFLIPRSEKLRLLGTVWNSSLFPGRVPQDHLLLTSFIGGATDPAAVKLSPTELVATIHREIAPLLSIHHPPAFSNVEIYDRAIPQYNLGHTSRIAAINRVLALHPNLRLAGNYLHGPAVGACVEQAQRVARQLASPQN
jgi:protoporphyrinogen/coproporphyrinogen III oxidase